MENVLIVNNEKAYEVKCNSNYYITKSGKLYSILKIGAHGRTDINNPRLVAYGQDKDGYYRVVLSNHAKKRYVKIHTLVAEQFLNFTKEDVISGLVVNHIDGNKHNNNVENLEIVTVKENNQHAWRTGLIDKTKNSLRIHVDVFDNSTNMLHHFTSLHDAMNFTKLDYQYFCRLRKNEITFGDCKFVKVVTGTKNTDYYVECYHNGELFKTFNNVKSAGGYFGKRGNVVSSAFKTKYPNKLNRYKITFLNVSTIENTTEQVGSE